MLNKGFALEDLTRYQAKFIRRLLKETGLRKKEFADRIGVTNVTVSRWVNGANAISDYHAQRIYEEFPEYRLAEIMGVLPQVEAYVLAMTEKAEAEKQLLFDVIALSFPGEIETLKGKVDCKLLDEGLQIKDDEGNWKPIVSDELKTEYKLSHDGKTLTLSSVQMEQFKDEIRGYIAMRLNQMLERGAW